MQKRFPLTALFIAVVLACALVILNGLSCLVAVGISSAVAALFDSDVVPGPKVGIVRIEGIIVSGRPPSPRSEGVTYSEQFIEIIRQAAENDDIKAIVLRINSPGGSVVGSNEIYQALLELDKPIVVSMGELAASGGYYVSCAADEILVNPGTLTGSIGVITQIPNIQELMKKIGVDVNIIKSGEFKDEGSPFRPMTAAERKIWQEIIDEAYGLFIQIVAEGRDLPLETVRELADGRIYTGLQAIELGLVDGVGDLTDAINRAGELGGIKGKPKLTELYEPPSLLESFLRSIPAPPFLSGWDNLFNLDRGPILQYLYTGQ